MTEIRAQQNRVDFDPTSGGGEYGDSAMGMDQVGVYTCGMDVSILLCHSAHDDVCAYFNSSNIIKYIFNSFICLQYCLYCRVC